MSDGALIGLERRLKDHAERRWPGCRVTVRCKGQYAYIGIQGPQDSEPAPLCRLRYTGQTDLWEFAYFTWARETYEPSLLVNGEPWGTPEGCFDAAAFPLLGGT